MISPQSIRHDRLEQLLWEHAAYQALRDVPTPTGYERIHVGYGWGLRQRSDRTHAILLHPSSTPQIGPLALTVLGSGTHAIPRCGSSYHDYLLNVTDVLTTTIQSLVDDWQ